MTKLERVIVAVNNTNDKRRKVGLQDADLLLNEAKTEPRLEVCAYKAFCRYGIRIAK